MACAQTRRRAHTPESANVLESQETKKLKTAQRQYIDMRLDDDPDLSFRVIGFLDGKANIRRNYSGVYIKESTRRFGQVKVEICHDTLRLWEARFDRFMPQDFTTSQWRFVLCYGLNVRFITLIPWGKRERQA